MSCFRGPRKVGFLVAFWVGHRFTKLHSLHRLPCNSSDVKPILLFRRSLLFDINHSQKVLTKIRLENEWNSTLWLAPTHAKNSRNKWNQSERVALFSISLLPATPFIWESSPGTTLNSLVVVK